MDLVGFGLVSYLPHVGQIIDSHYSTTVQDPDLPDKEDIFPMLGDLAHAAGWDRYDLHELHDLDQVSWVGSVLICRMLKLCQKIRLYGNL